MKRLKFYWNGDGRPSLGFRSKNQEELRFSRQLRWNFARVSFTVWFRSETKGRSTEIQKTIASAHSAGFGRESKGPGCKRPLHFQQKRSVLIRFKLSLTPVVNAFSIHCCQEIRNKITNRNKCQEQEIKYVIRSRPKNKYAWLRCVMANILRTLPKEKFRTENFISVIDQLQVSHSVTNWII